MAQVLPFRPPRNSGPMMRLNNYRQPRPVASTANHANWRTGKLFHELEVGQYFTVDEKEYAATASARAYFKRWYKRTYGQNVVIRSKLLRTRVKGTTNCTTTYMFWREK